MNNTHLAHLLDDYIDDLHSQRPPRIYFTGAPVPPELAPLLDMAAFLYAASHPAPTEQKHKIKTAVMANLHVT